MCTHNTYNQIALHANFTSSIVPLSAHDNSLTAYQVQYREVDTPKDVDDMFYAAVTVSTCIWHTYSTCELMLYTHLHMIAQTLLIYMPCLRPEGIFCIMN